MPRRRRVRIKPAPLLFERTQAPKRYFLPTPATVATMLGLSVAPNTAVVDEPPRIWRAKPPECPPETKA